ncbi:MAG: Asparaginase protein [Candidatus Levybacteria bacterium]|nr:Asparaginase protein [Candidatus Levybacteria bacterium]
MVSKDKNFRSNESKERIGAPTEVNFFKLGGTWDMIFRQDGAKIGSGSLDDNKLKELQGEVGIFTRDPHERRGAEKRLVSSLTESFEQSSSEPVDVVEHLSSWAKNSRGEAFGDFVSGQFVPLFSGDSSHLRNPIIAPMLSFLIKRAIGEPTRPILGGQGTDTADVALLGLFDVLTFDTKLPPLMLTGANRSHNEPNSDAPGNFVDLAKLATIDVGHGAFWIFQGNLYKGSDFVKIDPEESRKIESQSTFFAAHNTNQSIERLLDLKDKLKADWQSNVPPPENHVAYRVTAEALYDACEAVYTDDLGNQNSVPQLMNQVYNPDIKAIIVGAHSLGNVDNESRFDLVQAAKEGKLVIVASRTLIGGTNEEYAASLLYANQDQNELKDTGKLIISAHKLGKTMARAIAVRAIIDGLDGAETQSLLDNYARSRKLM